MKGECSGLYATSATDFKRMSQTSHVWTSGNGNGSIQRTTLRYHGSDNPVDFYFIIYSLHIFKKTKQKQDLLHHVEKRKQKCSVISQNETLLSYRADKKKGLPWNPNLVR